MRLDDARVARLATVAPDGQPHIVPVTFAAKDDTIVIAVDHKPKTTRNLKRLRNIRANDRVSLLVDHYDEDWHQLWWVRADGTARITETTETVAWLIEKYPQYQANPPEGPFILIAITHQTAWSSS
ncbi:TIGR03668 family PPOX class F420-dependent oxidoreductase [Kibdelosporangium philippinense]|uniref:TIGR03668 family PPOX class F420-dependent oxidoreductase n=1 Tax=Kibdelosporangium philippinense TaxID=211113 RepID=A0ABS8ZP01_9PSEU|nr:TIGR03668 family PPOX class F420-dependent oxidoreductase [Kibdelosporangium philippinense]MCE7008366.1 TIGR03668 family PPOX class F420-dependent oxidoreductase [Kibdelosporangium philippinense]